MHDPRRTLQSGFCNLAVVADHGGYDGRSRSSPLPGAPSVNLADIRRKGHHAAVKEEKGNRKEALMRAWFPSLAPP